MNATPQSVAELDAGFPRRRCSAAGIIHDQYGRILVVKPSYRPGWLLPGGLVEALETPASALRREVMEETGIATAIVRMLCMDMLPARDGFSESVHFLFECAPTHAEGDRSLPVDGIEILEARFLEAGQAMALLAAPIRRRLETVLNGRTGYLEDGHFIVPFACGEDAPHVTTPRSAPLQAQPLQEEYRP
ncbi:NUDIX hydrolase [Pseudoxanthomonas gei]|uniref:NUDIX hydrolase n=1 Tax=Pseudoxanthomonas gei TaxID=1383030 RepID=A0ABX0A9Y6_9GAMM|nr:NUDIX hydrolase [Pseudoxanthomonas gei]NDK38342.1 NUDIX hydrolase [Pseudoxanthomonas gei]